MLVSKKDGGFYPGQPVGGVANCSVCFPLSSLSRNNFSEKKILGREAGETEMMCVCVSLPTPTYM